MLLDDGFVMPFKAHLKEIGLDAEGVVRPLLQEVRRYADMEQVPGGRDGCGDCGLLEKVVEMVA